MFVISWSVCFGRRFQLNLIFVSKELTIEQNTCNVVYSGRLRPCSQALGKVGKTSLEQTLQLRKKFYRIATRGKCFEIFRLSLTKFSHYGRVFVKLGWNSLPGTNTSSLRKTRPVQNKHSSLLQIEEEKSFKRLPRGANVLKLFCPQFTDFRNKLVFFPAKLLQPSLMFAGKAGAYPNEALQGRLTCKHQTRL